MVREVKFIMSPLHDGRIWDGEVHVDGEWIGGATGPSDVAVADALMDIYFKRDDPDSW